MLTVKSKWLYCEFAVIVTVGAEVESVFSEWSLPRIFLPVESDIFLLVVKLLFKPQISSFPAGAIPLPTAVYAVRKIIHLSWVKLWDPVFKPLPSEVPLSSALTCGSDPVNTAALEPGGVILPQSPSHWHMMMMMMMMLFLCRVQTICDSRGSTSTSASTFICAEEPVPADPFTCSRSVLYNKLITRKQKQVCGSLVSGWCVTKGGKKKECAVCMSEGCQIWFIHF